MYQLAMYPGLLVCPLPSPEGTLPLAALPQHRATTSLRLLVSIETTLNQQTLHPSPLDPGIVPNKTPLSLCQTLKHFRAPFCMQQATVLNPQCHLRTPLAAHHHVWAQKPPAPSHSSSQIYTHPPACVIFPPINVHRDS